LADGAAIASRLAASKPTGEDGSNQIRPKIKATGQNQTEIRPIQTKKWQRHLPMVAASRLVPYAFCQSLPAKGGRPQGPFKIKKPSQSVRKNGKLMQVFLTPPRGGSRFRPKPPVWERKIPYFQAFYPCSKPSIHVVFNPKKHTIYDRFLQTPVYQ
jgi:hypothetical protein